MRKILVSIVVFILAIFTFNLSYAEVENADIPLVFTGTTSIVEGTENLTLTLSIGEFKNIPENPIIGYQATLEYDTDIFESVEVTGSNGWSAVYEKNNGNIVGESVNTASEKTEIATFKFKLKSDAKPGKANITLKNIKINAQPLTGTGESVTLNKEEKVEVTITAKESQNQEPSSEEPKTQQPVEEETKKQEQPASTQQQPTTQENKGETKQVTTTIKANEDKTATSNILPKTGLGKLATALAIIIIIGTISLIRYKTIRIK